MITVDLREAGDKICALLKVVEEQGEAVVFERDGVPVAEIRSFSPAATMAIRDLTPDPRLRPILAPGYNPSEPLSDDEWQIHASVSSS
jgi:hypothetical protein